MKFNIVGLQKNSFIDYPASISTVVFTPGCNMNCWYCHNCEIINQTEGTISVDDVLEFLRERVGFIDAVVVTGGEPTLQSELPAFFRAVKEMGFKTKLDTNGTNLAILKHLVEEKLLDYIAMDIKAPFEKYGKITMLPDIAEVQNSVELIKNCGVDYEFRTTFAPNLYEEEILALLQQISKTSPVKVYSLQAYIRPAHITVEKLKNHEESVFHTIKEKAISNGWVEQFNIKNF